MDMHAHDRRRCLAIGAATAASATPLLTACGAGFGGDKARNDGSAADDVTGPFDWKRAKGRTVKALLNKHPYTDALIADLKAFTEKTGVRVEYDVFPEDNYFDKLTVDLSSGRASYDVFMLGAYMVWQYGPPGWLEDLGPWMRNSSATGAEWDQEGFFPNLLSADQWSLKAGAPLGRGGQYALPWGWETNVVAYNTEVFRKLGLKPAETFDELREVAGAITRRAPGAGFDGMYGVAVRGSRSWATIHPGFMTMYARNGLKDFTVEGSRVKYAITVARTGGYITTAFSHGIHALWIAKDQCLPVLILSHGLASGGRTVVCVQLRYAFRIEPGPGQRIALGRAFGCARVVFNDCLRARKRAHEQGAPYPTSAELSKRYITEAKKTPERSWLGEVSSVVLQQSLRDLDTAYRNFFASIKGTRKGPKIAEPRFKSKRDSRQCVRFTANAKWSITPDGKLNLPKIGPVRVRWSRALPSVPSTVTVIKDAADRYWASFVVETYPAGEALPALDREQGIDLGLTHFAVMADGSRVRSPRFLRRAEKKLKREQRSLSRKKKGSKNRGKQRVKVARAHAKVADARRDFHHKLSTKLIRENQAVSVESLSVKGLARTRLAKSVHDAGWSSFVTMLEYKASRYGRTLTKVDRAFPSSQVCSSCGHRDGPKPLDIRTWICPRCGARQDRDHNAGTNIRDEGRRIRAAHQAVPPTPGPGASRR